MSNSDAGEPDRTSGIGERHSFLGNNPGSSTESNSGPLTLQSYELRSFVWLVGSLFVRDAPQSSKLWGVTPRMGAWFRQGELGVSDVPYPTQVHFIYFQGRSVRYELRMPASLPYLAIRDMVAMSRSFRGRQRPNSGSRGPEISGTRVRQRFPLGGSGIPSVSVGGPSHS